MTRVGASQAFFNIVAHMNAKRLISDVASLETIMKAVSIDTFEAMMKPFDEFGQMIQQTRAAVEQLGIDVGNAMIEFEKFYGGGQSMERVAASVIEVGEAYAMTATESLAAASRAAQVANIIGQANVDLLVEQAMVLAEISDLNVEESQRALIKLQQQANIMYGEYTAAQVRGLPLEMQRKILLDETTASLDALNTIANRSVALEGDLVQTMTNFASQGNLVGESFEFMAAASATLLEAGEEQGTAGRALRMMYARLGGNISGAADEIEALGIQVRDSNGDMITMQEVLGNVSAQGWDTMSASLKMNIAQTISGNRHYVRFIKLMDNYARTVRLAEEGQMGLDSAVSQADRALSRQSKRLEKTQVKMENLKASIGQGLTPAFIHANRVQNAYLEQVNLLIGGTGDLGVVFGRLAASLKITGGFVKFGLALQSVGIGFGMYESVMKSLHGMEIANQSLHSKQANYLDYSLTATKKQEHVQRIMQFLQQKMNAASEQQRLSTLQINALLRQRKEIEDILTPMQEKTNANLTKRANVSQEITSLNVLQTDLAKRQMTSYQTKLAYMEHDKRIGGDLLERQKKLYSERTFAEEAYKRQFITDVSTMNNLRKGDIKNIIDGNQKLRTRHSTLQDLKAANEAARAARDENDRGLIRTSALKKKDSEAMIKRINHEMTLARRSRKSTTDEGQIDFYKNRLKGLGQFRKQVKNMEKGLFQVGSGGGMMKQGFDEMARMLKDTGGQIIQSDRVMQAYNETLIKNGTIQRQTSILTGMKTKLNNNLKVDLSKINQLTKEDAILQAQLEPFLDKNNQLDEEKIANAKEYEKMITILMDKEADYAEATAKYKKKQQQEDDEQNARLRMSQRQVAFATTSLVSVLAGAAGGAAGVTGSMVAMGTQIGFATGEVVKSTKALIYQSAEAAKNAGKFATMGEALTAYGIRAAKIVGVITAVTAAITLFNHLQMQQKKAVERTRKEIEKLNQVMLSMESNTKLFGTEDGLADHLGIANYELGELVSNADLTNTIFTKLNNQSSGLDSNMQSVVDNSVNMLSTLMAIQEQSNVINESGIREARRAIRSDFDSFGNFMDSLFFSYGDKDAAKELADVFLPDGDYMARGMDAAMQQIVGHIADQMEEGRELTENEWYLLEDALGDNSWADGVMTNLEKIDRLTMSSDMLDIVTKNLTHNNEVLTGVFEEERDAVNNLEQDIRNFANTREELFFGGKYGNITGSLYKQVVQQGVGVLYNKQEVIVSNVFHGFFNEQEAANRIKSILKTELASM